MLLVTACTRAAQIVIQNRLCIKNATRGISEEYWSAGVSCIRTFSALEFELSLTRKLLITGGAYPKRLSATLMIL